VVAGSIAAIKKLGEELRSENYEKAETATSRETDCTKSCEFLSKLAAEKKPILEVNQSTNICFLTNFV
jgi:hypothetical protein